MTELEKEKLEEEKLDKEIEEEFEEISGTLGISSVLTFVALIVLGVMSYLNH